MSTLFLQVLGGVFVAGFAVLLANLVFFAFYRACPSQLATILNVSTSERTNGNATLIVVLVRYEIERGKPRLARIVISGDTRNRTRLFSQADALRNHFGQGKAAYYYVPGLLRFGVLDGAVRPQQLWTTGLMAVILAFVSWSLFASST